MFLLLSLLLLLPRPALGCRGPATSDKGSSPSSRRRHLQRPPQQASDGSSLPPCHPLRLRHHLWGRLASPARRCHLCQHTQLATRAPGPSVCRKPGPFTPSSEAASNRVSNTSAASTLSSTQPCQHLENSARLGWRRLACVPGGVRPGQEQLPAGSCGHGLPGAPAVKGTAYWGSSRAHSPGSLLLMAAGSAVCPGDHQTVGRL